MAGLWLNRPGDGKAAPFCGRDNLTKNQCLGGRSKSKIRTPTTSQGDKTTKRGCNKRMFRGDGTTSCCDGRDETMRGRRNERQHDGGSTSTTALQILRQGYGKSTLQRLRIGTGIGHASTANATGEGGEEEEERRQRGWDNQPGQ